MKRKYLLLGGSSDICAAFLRKHSWSAEDEIVAQYNKHADSLRKIAREIPAKLIVQSADFSSLDDTKAFADFLQEHTFVPTHILHAPAIPIQNQRFIEIEWKEAEQQFNVQCRSLYLILQTVLPKMTKAKTGNIVVVVSSYSLNLPPAFLSAYVMAKYALMGLVKALAVEYASKQIRCNMISPSMIETKFLANVYDGVVEQTAKRNPSRRNASPEDAANLIEYLFSEQNTFMQGANIPLTGGEA